jgi:hypothetical protein
VQDWLRQVQRDSLDRQRHDGRPFLFHGLNHGAAVFHGAE